MATTARSKANKLTARELGERIGVKASTIRARRSRGTKKLDAPPQLRLDQKQSLRIARARGSAAQVAARCGCSPTTVKRLRHKFAGKTTPMR